MKEIAWNTAVCASTNAELGDALGQLRSVTMRMAAPANEYILGAVGARDSYMQVMEMVTHSLRGLDTFVEIQDDYLLRITAPSKPQYALRPIAYLQPPAPSGFDTAQLHAGALRDSGTDGATWADDMRYGNTSAPAPVTGSWTDGVHYGKGDR